CKYRNQIHLIRGNHEDPEINCVYGFQDECRRRLREDPQAEESCWFKFNKAFEWLPVAALIEDKILCIHGGIGGSIQSMKDIATIMRPLKIAQVPSNEYVRCEGKEGGGVGGGGRRENEGGGVGAENEGGMGGENEG
ncbi:kelch repeat domain containing/Serine/threonine protein phosphatase protein, partial [Cardiosporidium cionae]